MSVLTITNENYLKEVENSEKPVLLDFWAPWCMPCRMASPIVESIADETVGQVSVGKINVDSERQLAEKFNVYSIPTLVVLQNGREAARSVGLKSRNGIMKMIREAQKTAQAGAR